MTDGDGEGNTSPDPISEWQVEQLDAGNELSPLSSRYSSCGESEFDKYFSSNSVMGTPSMRSSVGPFESEFGSLKSLHDFSLGGSFERKVDDKKIVCVGGPNERIDGVLELYDGSSGCRDYHLGSTAEVIPDLSTALVEGLYDEDDGRVLSWDCAMSGETQSFNDNHMSGKENAQTNREDVSNFGVGAVDGDLHSSRRIDHFDNCLDQWSTEAGMGCDITKSGKCSHDGEASSRYEYSEGEDSLFGYGSGDEKRIDSNDTRCIQVPCDENKIKETVLLMNSSTAFGSDDWDDYMQETNANPLSTVPDDFWVKKQQTVESDKDCCTSTFASSNGFQNICLPLQQEGKTSDNLSHDAEELTVDIGTYSTDNLLIIGDTGKKDICAVTDRFGALSLPKQLPHKCSGRNLHAKDQDLPTKDPSLKVALKIRKDESKGKHSCTSTEDETSVAHASDMKSEKTNSQLDSITKVKVSHLHATPKDVSEAIQRESLEGHISNTLQFMTENNVNRTMKENPASDHPAPVKVGSHKINEFYDEIVHDMEEILLDANRSPGARLTQGNRSSQFQITMPLRDGSSTASTSNSDNAYSLMNRPLRIDRVEVIGARQKKGDVSLSERLVGVKEYTVYRLQVWSGEDKWEVERRYRDFYTLYRRLKTLFADQGWILPSPWSSVERESRKIFGNASPAAVAERSVLIKDCLQSLLDSQFSFSHSSALMWFLSTPKADRSSPAPVTEMHGSTLLTGDHAESISAFGKTISLVVDIWPNKSKRQILESQNYTCSGCHKHFDNGKTRIQDLVQNLGWGKPRLCEYSGQFFCASCHTNETAVLPARVLHFWDFAQYPVSQLAKYYLDSIHDQPMLCVSAINPLLFSKVPALQHVTNVRKRIGAMLPYVRCPFRRTIFKGLGSRRYLLESYDFFALRDLIDLSKGVFAVLPAMVETVSKKILEHITEQCLVCCDVGVPCNARQACEDPSSLIFPFQEGDVKRCRSCKLVFHKCCFKKITTCPCGVRLKLDKAKELENKGNMDVDSDSSRTLDLVGRQDDSWSSVSLLSGLFSKTRLEKLVGHKDDNVIPMASLPNTSL